MSLKLAQRPAAVIGTSPVQATLSPSQTEGFTRLRRLAEVTNVIGLFTPSGLGKTTVLREYAEAMGADLIDLGDILKVIAPLEALYWEEQLSEWLLGRLAETDCLVIDGLIDFQEYTTRRHHTDEPRLEVLYKTAERLGKVLILSATKRDQETTEHRVFHRPDLPVVSIMSFTHADYAHFARNILGSKADGINFSEIFRFASVLNGHELRAACSVLEHLETPTTADFIEALEQYVVSANVNTAEVEDIRFETMPGMEGIASALDTHVVLPLTDMALAEELDLRAKRGILLYGPPGSGKTSVGRALAHRLKGKFFLIDGSVRTEPAHAFLQNVQAIVHEALENAPAVIFIDDADVLFEVGHVAGLTRYLLTLLDGLSGVNASKVCVMMTAMDPSKVPEAILRSGRVELWLETHLPPAPVRAGILERWLGTSIPAFAETDFIKLGEMAENFTPADLRRVVADAKALYAMDRVRDRETVSGTAYIQRAIGDVIASRAAMAVNLADPSLRVA